MSLEESVLSGTTIDSYPWQVIVDPATQQIYYYNSVSEVTQWELPDDFVYPSQTLIEEDSNPNIQHVDFSLKKAGYERVPSPLISEKYDTDDAGERKYMRTFPVEVGTTQASTIDNENARLIEELETYTATMEKEKVELLKNMNDLTISKPAQVNEDGNDSTNTEIILLRQNLSDTDASLQETKKELTFTLQLLDEERQKRAAVHAEREKEREKIKRAEESTHYAEEPFNDSEATSSFQQMSLALSASQYMYSKAEFEISKGNYRNASTLLKECYSIRKTHEYGSSSTADTCQVLSDNYLRTGELQEAMIYNREAQESQKLLYGDLAEQTCASLHTYAAIKSALGELRISEELFISNKATRLEVNGDVGAALHGLSEIQLKLGRYKDAYDNAEKGYNFRTRVHKGLKHVSVLETLILKAKICNAKGDYDGGNTLGEQAIANIRFLTESDSNPMVAQALHVIGESQYGLGMFIKALDRFDRAASMAIEYLGENHYLISMYLSSKIKTQLQLGNYNGARKTLGHFSPMKSHNVNNGNISLFTEAEIAISHALYHKALGAYNKANFYFQKAIESYNKIYESMGPQTLQFKSHPVVAEVLLEYGDNCRRLGHYENAQHFIEYAKDVVGETVGRDHPLYGVYLHYAGDLLMNLAAKSHEKIDFDTADRQLRRALNLRRAILHESHYDLSVTLNSLGELCRLQCNFDDAERCYEEALQIRCDDTVDSIGPDHWSVSNIKSNQALLLAAKNALQCQSDCHFTSDPIAPLPIFARQSFLEASVILHKVILKLQLKLHTTEVPHQHPILINIMGNFGVVKKMENVAKNEFINKLNKTHRKLFQELEDSIFSGASNEEVMYKDIRYKNDSRAFIQAAMSSLKSAGIHEDHYWLKKFEQYDVEEAASDEMMLAESIIEEGNRFTEVGKYINAEDRYEVALDLLRNMLGEENIVHPVVNTLILSMADNYRHQARYREARVMYEKCLVLSLKLYEHDSFEVAKVYLGMGNLYISISRYSHAQVYINRALDCQTQAEESRSNDEANIIAKVALAECLFANGKYVDAQEILKEIMSNIRTGIDNQVLIRALLIEARIHHAMNRMQDALKLLNDANKHCKDIGGRNEDNPLIAKVMMYMALCNFDLNKFALSMNQIQTAAEMASRFYGIKNVRSKSVNVDDIVHLEDNDDAKTYRFSQSVFHKLETSEILFEGEGPCVHAIAGDVMSETDYKSSRLDVKRGINDIHDRLHQKNDMEPYNNDHVFTVDYHESLQGVYKYGGLETKSHPFLAELVLVKAQFLMKLMIHESKIITNLIDVAIAMQKTTFGAMSIEFAHAQFSLACFEFLRGNWNESLELLEIVNGTFTNLYSKTHPSRLDTLYWIAEIKVIFSHLSDALNMHRVVLSMRRATFGENHPKCIDSVISIMNCIRLMGKSRDSEETIDTAKAMIKSTFCIDIPDPCVSRSYLVFGMILKDIGQYDRAIAYIERSLTMYVSLYGDSDGMVATCLFHLAETLSSQGKLLESRERNEQCMRIRETKLPPTHCDMAQSLFALATNYSDLGMYRKSLILFKMSLKILKRVFQSDSKRNIFVTHVINGLGVLFLRMGYYHFSSKLFQKTSQSQWTLYDKNHPESLSTRYYMSITLLKLGKVDMALTQHKEILNIRRESIGRMHKDIASSLHIIGVCMIHRGEYLEARSHVERSLNMRKKLLGMEHPDVADSFQSLGWLHDQQGKLVEALAFYERALNNRRVSLGSQHPLVAEILCRMARIHNQQHNISIAYDLLLDSLRIRTKVFGGENIITCESIYEIANNLMISGLYNDKKKPEVGISAVSICDFVDGNQMGNYHNKCDHHMQEEFFAVDEMYESDTNFIDLTDVQVIRLDSLFDIADEDGKGIDGPICFDGKSGTGKSDILHSCDAELVEKSSFVSAHHLYLKVRDLRLQWLDFEHPIVLEVMHALNVSDRLKGNMKDCHERACSLLLLCRKVHGTCHPEVISSFIEVAASLRGIHKIQDKSYESASGFYNVHVEETRRGRLQAGPALIDQLKSSFRTNYLNKYDVRLKNGIVHDRWASSTSHTLLKDRIFQNLSSRRQMTNKSTLIGYMGYAYPEKKFLFEERKISKFGKLKVDDALWLLESAEKLYFEIFGENEESPLLASILFERGLLLIAKRDEISARKVLELCVDMRRRVLRNGHPSIADGLHAIAESYRVENEIKSAEPLYQTSLEIKLKEYGPNHPSVADTVNSCAMLEFAKGSYAICKVYYLKALEIREQYLGIEHPAVAQTLINLAGVLQLEGEFIDAERMYQRALSIRQHTLGDHHPEYASGLNNLGLLLKSRGKYSDAKILYQRAIKIQEDNYGLVHPDIAATLNNLAALSFSEGNWTDAKVLYTRSIDMKRKVLGAEHPSIALAQNNLAGLLYLSGEFDEAVAVFRDSLRTRESIYGNFHPLVAESMNNLSIALLSTRKVEESNIWYDRSLEIMIRCYDKNHPAISIAKMRRIEALKRTENCIIDTSFICTTSCDLVFPNID